MDIRSKLRLIPACAGKTMMPLIALDRIGAHPRVCGENHFAKAAKRFGEGSSPRVRGKQRRAALKSTHFGLIPACAGKTF